MFEEENKREHRSRAHLHEAIDGFDCSNTLLLLLHDFESAQKDASDPHPKITSEYEFKHRERGSDT